jgi:hypothetical protein
MQVVLLLLPCWRGLLARSPRRLYVLPQCSPAHLNCRPASRTALVVSFLWKGLWQCAAWADGCPRCPRWWLCRRGFLHKQAADVNRYCLDTTLQAANVVLAAGKGECLFAMQHDS